MKSLRKSILLIVALCAFVSGYAQTNAGWKALKGNITLYVANDLGRNGYYEQKPVAELMGTMAETLGPAAVLAPGDIHHFNGVASVSDPLWMTNYELVYSHPELMLDWFPLLGNHEYRGNTQAVLDYGKISRRWMMPARYYTKVFKGKGTTLRIVMIDTTPLIDRYREASDKYPDACKQDYNRELQWVDSVLTVAKEDWVVCLGHHPIYADTDKSEAERQDMQNRLLPVLKKHANVAMYISGHIHNFQHIRKAGDNIDYVVNSSASLSRPNVKAVDGTVFCDGRAGFSVLSATKQHLDLYMIDSKGNVIYKVEK